MKTTSFSIYKFLKLFILYSKYCTCMKIYRNPPLLVPVSINSNTLRVSLTSFFELKERCTDHVYYTWLVHPSLGSMLIRQRWKASLLDVGLSKSMRVASTLRPFPKWTIPDWEKICSSHTLYGREFEWLCINLLMVEDWLNFHQIW